MSPSNETLEAASLRRKREERPLPLHTQARPRAFAVADTNRPNRGAPYLRTA